MGNLIESIQSNLLYMGIILLLVFAVGTYLLFRYNYIYRLMDMWKPNAPRKYAVKIFGEDRQIRDRTMVIGRYVVLDDVDRKAYHLAHEAQLTLNGTKKKFLAVTQRDAWPIDFHNQLSKEDRKRFPRSQRVFLDASNDVPSRAARDAEGNQTMTILSIIALAGALAVIVVALIMFAT